MKRSAALPAVLAAACLSGCLGPTPQIPEGARVAPPAAFRSPTGAATTDADWWRAFGDPGLSAVVEQALAHNTDIGQAVERVEQARAIERQARAARGPEIDAQNIGGYTRALGPPVASTPFATPEVTASWDLDLFHRLREADRAARAELLASEGARDAVRLSVAATAAGAYIGLLGLDQRLAIIRQGMQLRTVSLHTAQHRAAVGYTSALEVHQAQAEYDAVAALAPATELARARLEDALSVVTGRPPASVPRTAAGLDRTTIPAVPGGLPSTLLERRPDIFAAEEAIVAADHSLRSARAAMLPDFALTGFVGEEFAAPLPHGEVEYLIANSIVGPLFDSGRRKAVAQQVAAQRDQAAYAYKGVVLSALKEVDDALEAVRRDREQDRWFAAQTGVEAETLRLARKRYLAGYTPYFDQIDAERQLLLAQLELAQTRTAWLTAYVSLYQALGGGWREDSFAKGAAAPRPKS